MIPTYNIQQRVMALNLFSNLASNKTGTADVLQEELSKMLNGLFADPDMIKLIGQWKVVWGPVVVELGIDSNKLYHVATNAMYVAIQENYDGQGNNHYVVATAGTNALSLYGWFVEDFKTNQMTLWKDVVPNLGKSGVQASGGKTIDKCLVAGNQEADKPRVSRGTCIGVTALFDMEWLQQPTGTVSKYLRKLTHNGKEMLGQSLYSFLCEKFSGSNRTDLVTVTGHSLGGALSASMALKLCELQAGDDKITDYWNPSHSVTLTAMPSAGASPGNKVFSEYYGNKMGLKTNRIWNRMDPVPYGHEPNMLQYLPQLYYPYIVPDAGLYGFAGYMLANSYAGTAGTVKEGGYYTQLMPETPGLDGSYNSVSAPLPPNLMYKISVDLCYYGIFKAMGLPDTTIKKIMPVLNEIINVQIWLGFKGLLAEKIMKELSRLFPGDGTLVKSILNAIAFVYHNIESLLSFLGQLGYQHVWAYPQLLKMVGFEKIMTSHMKKEKAPDESEIIAKYLHNRIVELWDHIFHPDILERNGIKKISA